jgi:rRNA maturation endonuclease Nob1
MRPAVGDTIRNEVRWGPRPTSVVYRCPGCKHFLKRTAESCALCGTTFVQLTEGVVQVVSVAR